MEYARILPLDVASLPAGGELSALATVWAERRSALEGEGRLGNFLLKLQREWAIETGIIERLYVWDRGVTEVLIEQGIDAAIIAHRAGIKAEKAQSISDMIADHYDIVEGLFDYVKGERPLSEHYIRSLHQQFTRNQPTTTAIDHAGRLVEIPLLRGEYKKRPNNPRRPDGITHAYCPPELVDEEMKRLVESYASYEGAVVPEALSAWLHHRFTQIHPFQDGNGRVARAVASLVFLRAGLFLLVVRERDRTEYIEALEQADAGHLNPLISLFARRQRDAILGALNADQRSKRQAMAVNIVDAALAALQSRADEERASYEQVRVTAAGLKAAAVERLRVLSSDLDGKVRPLSTGGNRYRAGARGSTQVDSHWYYSQTIEAAKRLDYYANFNPYCHWAALAIDTRDAFYLVVAFHGLGASYHGILAASAFTFRRIAGEDGPEVVGFSLATNELFQFNYVEPASSVQERFNPWLEEAVITGLESWRRALTTS